MKTTLLTGLEFTLNRGFNFLWLLICLFIFNSCSDTCETTVTYTITEPIFMTRGELARAVKSEPAQELVATGKIYAKDQYVFINEPQKGIHVIDNTNPAAPENVAFINIPGNVDLAIRDNILLADAGPDLMAIDITDPTNAVLKKHTYNLFPNQYQTGTTDVNSLVYQLCVGTKTRTVTEVNDCNDAGYGTYENHDRVFYANSKSASPTAAFSSGGPTTGIGGSMARFTIYDNYLYAINHSFMQVMNIASPANPQHGASINVGWGIETIFPYKDKLFLGSNTGMHIYENKVPATPTKLSFYSHLQGCDPVVVDDKYAYVTIRNGATCRNNAPNTLEVVDISDLKAPKSVKIYPMQNPHGLGIDQNTLFICEGDFGLKTFDASNPKAITDNQLAHFKDLHAFDVIPLGYTLLTIGKDGLYQYDYRDPKNIKLLSKIPVKSQNQ